MQSLHLNLMDETFPEFQDFDDMIGHLITPEAEIKPIAVDRDHNFVNSSTSLSASMSLTSSVLSSAATTIISTAGVSNLSARPNYIKRQTSQSCQDLYSQKNKKKYDHVESKVKKYIADITSSKDKLVRHKSMPETLSNISSSTIDFQCISRLEEDPLKTDLSEENANLQKLNSDLLRENENLRRQSEWNMQDRIMERSMLNRKIEAMRLEITNRTERNLTIESNSDTHSMDTHSNTHSLDSNKLSTKCDADTQTSSSLSATMMSIPLDSEGELEEGYQIECSTLRKRWAGGSRNSTNEIFDFSGAHNDDTTAMVGENTNYEGDEEAQQVKTPNQTKFVRRNCKKIKKKLAKCLGVCIKSSAE